MLSGSVSGRSRELFGLYKPLLDARSRHRQDARQPAWLVAQLGQSLDGFIATTTGDSFFVNGQHSLWHLHRLRALCDAVLVGAGTVAIDNPQLTTRFVPGPAPVRVVLDPAGRLDGQSRVFQDGQSPTLWVCDAAHAPRLRAVLNGAPTGTGVELVSIHGLLGTGASPCQLPGRVVQALSDRGLRLVFVEGGGVTVSRFFRAGALDRLHLAMAPVLIGEGRRGLQAQPHEVMAHCLRPAAVTVPLGNDVLWDMALR